MINETKIRSIQAKIKKAISQIESEENVKIEFGKINYNSAFYNTSMKVTTLVETISVKETYERICKLLGFTQNVIGMEFEGRNGKYKITEIKTKNRKYPVIAVGSDGKSYKFPVSMVKSFLGGDKKINRDANLEKLLGM